MSNEQDQHEYEQSLGAQAMAEYEQEMAYYAYLDSLIAGKQYQLHAIQVTLDMLNSLEFRNSGLSAVEFLINKRAEITTIKNKP